MNRRNFVRTSAALTASTLAFEAIVNPANADIATTAGPYFIGPTEGYSPQIGTLVSMLNYNRMTVLNAVGGMTMDQLDFLFDKKANSIGALLMHLGATNAFYHVNTFEKRELNEPETKLWGSAMELGDKGRSEIKGHELKYYVDLITEVRKDADPAENKDDAWLLAVDPDPNWSRKDMPLNCYWKWFHVCEHESNHRGQISWLKSRLPGAKDSKE